MSFKNILCKIAYYIFKQTQIDGKKLKKKKMALCE